VKLDHKSVDQRGSFRRNPSEDWTVPIRLTQTPATYRISREPDRDRLNERYRPVADLHFPQKSRILRRASQAENRGLLRDCARRERAARMPPLRAWAMNVVPALARPLRANFVHAQRVLVCREAVGNQPQR
jgi:hypothetical protein